MKITLNEYESLMSEAATKLGQCQTENARLKKALENFPDPYGPGTIEDYYEEVKRWHDTVRQEALKAGKKG